MTPALVQLFLWSCAAVVWAVVIGTWLGREMRLLDSPFVVWTVELPASGRAA